MLINAKNSRKKFYRVFCSIFNQQQTIQSYNNFKQLNPRKMNIFVDFESQEDHYSTQNSQSNPPKEENSREKPKQKKRYQRSFKDVDSENSYHWTLAEHKKYIDFLIKKRSLFNLSVKEKKKVKMHVLMYNYILTKNAKQCRSHHQKMLSKYSTIEGILEEYGHLANPTIFSKAVAVEEQKEQMKEEEPRNPQNGDEVGQYLDQFKTYDVEYPYESHQMNMFDFEASLELPFNMFFE